LATTILDPRLHVARVRRRVRVAYGGGGGGGGSGFGEGAGWNAGVPEAGAVALVPELFGAGAVRLECVGAGDPALRVVKPPPVLLPPVLLPPVTPVVPRSLGRSEGEPPREDMPGLEQAARKSAAVTTAARTSKEAARQRIDITLSSVSRRLVRARERVSRGVDAGVELGDYGLSSAAGGGSRLPAQG
jgi:hypothetical protein